MNKKLLLVATCIVLALSMLVTGCVKTNTATLVGEQKVTINLGSEPPQLNSILTTDSTSGNVLRHVQEGLIRLDQKGNPIGGIAEKWESSDNGMKWTFTLRDAKWSDGTPITAEDFKYSFLKLLNKDTASEYAYIAYYIKGAEAYNKGTGKEADVGIKVIDPKKLEISLEKPAPFFISMLSFYSFLPVKKDVIEKYGDKYGSEADKMAFNGPWTIKEWKHEDSITLVKNPNYWNAKEIKLEEIKMLMIKDTNAAYNGYKAGDLDMIGLNGDQLAMLKAEGTKTYNYNDGSSWYFEFNLNDKIMANNNIRKALTYAIDRTAFVTGAVKNSSKPALSFTNPVVFDDKGKSFADGMGKLVKDNDSKTATELFDKGLKELGLTKDKLPKIELIADDTDTARKYTQAFQEMWKKNLGFEVTITNLPFKARLDRMTKKEFSIVMAGWGPDYNDPMSFLDMFETGNGNNHTSYSNKDYDAMVKSAQNEKDAKKRMDTLRNMEKKLMEDLPIGPIYFRYRDYVTSEDFKGVVRDWNQDINLYWAYVGK